MLAPGDYLLIPASEPPPAMPGTRDGAPTPPPAPPAEVEEPEPQSFLLILLRALGAIHT
jgi:hypothetical protein